METAVLRVVLASSGILRTQHVCGSCSRKLPQMQRKPRQGGEAQKSWYAKSKAIEEKKKCISFFHNRLSQTQYCYKQIALKFI